MHISLDSALGRQRRLNSVGESVFQIAPDAAAGYSLRSLTGGDPLVVRVRRESDNGERDFRSSEINSGEMVNWVNQQVIPPLDLRTLTATGRDGPIIEAAAAYSLRNLSDSYTGSVVEVRRSSDDAVRSFTAAEVTDGTLEAWVGAGNDGTVSKWYDQSTTSGVPNNRHAVNSDPAEQPSIVINGALYSNGISIGSNQHLWSPSNFNVSLNNISSFVYGAASGGQGVGALTTTVSTGTFSNPYRFSNTQGYRYGGEGAAAQPNNSATQLFTLIGSPTIAEGFSNGTSYKTSTVSTSSYTNRNIKIGSSSGNLITGNVHEVIYYNTDQTDNRTALEANIGEFYGIAGIPAYDNTVNGFVETWYDQSGNGNNATQLTAGSQPKIVDAGALVAGGIDFDGTNDLLETASLGASQPITAFSVFTQDSASSTIYGSSGSHALITSSSNAISLNAGTALVSSTSIGLGTPALVSSLANSTSSFTFINGGNTTTGNAGTTGITGSLKLGNTSSNRAMEGTLQEFIIYNSDQSDNRLAIETNINNQYDIY